MNEMTNFKIGPTPSKAFFTNIVIKLINNILGVLFCMPIVQLENIFNNFWVSKVNTCQTRTAYMGNQYGVESPNRSFIIELQIFIYYIKLNITDEQAQKIIGQTSTGKQISIKIIITALECVIDICHMQDFQKWIMPNSAPFKNILKIKKNRILVLNGVGPGDSDPVGASTDENTNAISQFCKGINLSFTRGRVTVSLECKNKSNFNTLISNTPEDAIKINKIVAEMLNQHIHNFNLPTSEPARTARQKDKKDFWTGSFLLETIMFAIIERELNLPNSTQFRRRKILENFAFLKEDIKNKKGGLFKITNLTKANYSDLIYDFCIDSIYDGVEIIDCEHKQPLINLSNNFYSQFRSADHETQLLFFVFDDDGRTFNDMFIGKNDILCAPLSIVLEKWIYPHIPYYKKNGLNILEIIEIIKILQCGLGEKLTPSKLNECKMLNVSEHSRKFGEYKDGNEYQIPINYSTNITIQDLYKCFDLNIIKAKDIRYNNGNIDEKKLLECLKNNKKFKDENDFNNLISANDLATFSEYVSYDPEKKAVIEELLNILFSLYFDWIRKDFNKLIHIPMSLFDKLTENDFENMSEDQQLVILNKCNNQLKANVIYLFATCIKPNAIATLQLTVNNNEAFAMKISNLVPYFNAEQINAIDFEALDYSENLQHTKEMLNNLLFVKLNLISVKNLKKINLTNIDEELCLKVLTERLFDENENLLISQKQILQLNANIAKELDSKIIIKLMSKKIQFSPEFTSQIDIINFKKEMYTKKDFSIYYNFIISNYQNISDKQLSKINLDETFPDTNFENQKKSTEFSSLTNYLINLKDPLYNVVFKINNFTIQEKNISSENFEIEIYKNAWKYIFENHISFEYFINNFFAEGENVKSYKDEYGIFKDEKFLSELIQALDFSLLSIKILNKIIEHFLNKNIIFLNSQLSSIKDLSQLIIYNLKKLLIINKNEINSDHLKSIFTTNNMEDSNYVEIVLFILASDFDYKNCINFIDIKKIKEFIFEINSSSLKENFIKVLDENIMYFSQKQIVDIGILNNDQNITYPFVLKRLEIILGKNVYLKKALKEKENLPKSKEFSEEPISEESKRKLINLKDTFVNLYEASTYKTEYTKGLISNLYVLKNKFVELDNNWNKNTAVDLLNQISSIYQQLVQEQNSEQKYLDGMFKKLNIPDNTKQRDIFLNYKSKFQSFAGALCELPFIQLVKINLDNGFKRQQLPKSINLITPKLLELEQFDLKEQKIKIFIKNLANKNFAILLMYIYTNSNEFKSKKTLDAIFDLVIESDPKKDSENNKFISELFNIQEIGFMNEKMQHFLSNHLVNHFARFLDLLNQTDKSTLKYKTLINFFVTIINTLNDELSNKNIESETLNKIKSAKIIDENDSDEKKERKKLEIKNNLFGIMDYCSKKHLFKFDFNYFILEIIKSLDLQLEYKDIQKYFINDKKSLEKTVSLINITFLSLNNLKTIIENLNENVKFSKLQLWNILRYKYFHELTPQHLLKIVIYNINEMNNKQKEIFFSTLFDCEKNNYKFYFSKHDYDISLYNHLKKFAIKTDKYDHYEPIYKISTNETFYDLFSLYNSSSNDLKEFSKKIFSCSINNWKNFKNFCLNIGPHFKKKGIEILFFKMILDNINNLSDEQIDIFEKDDFKYLYTSKKYNEIINTLIQIINKISDSAKKNKFCSKLPMKILFKVCFNDDIFNYITNEENLNLLFKEIIESKHNNEDFISEDISSFLSKNPQYLLKQILNIKYNDYKFTIKSYLYRIRNFEKLLRELINFIETNDIIFKNEKKFLESFKLVFNYKSSNIYEKLRGVIDDFFNSIQENYNNSLPKLAKANIKYLPFKYFEKFADKIKLSNKELNNMNKACKKNLINIENSGMKFYYFCENNSSEIKKLNNNSLELIFEPEFKNNNEYTIKKIIMFYFEISLDKFSVEDITEIKKFCNDSNNQKIITTLCNNFFFKKCSKLQDK